MSTDKKDAKMAGKAFNASSPGFLYSIIVAILATFAATGIQFPASPDALAGTITTSLSSGGVYAIIGVLITSVIFPIYNHFSSKGKFDFKAIFSKVSTWIAWGTAGLSAIALTGFVLPDGTLEQVIGAIQQKDWMSLISILALTVGNTLIRFLKDRQAATT